jgi:hypothetical protein
MKSITIDGTEFMYKCFFNYTEFYLGVEEEKYGIFGNKTRMVPKKAFSIFENVESLYSTKEEVREIVIKAYNGWKDTERKKTNRLMEISRGEII